jgi:hypothetical protein
VIPVQTHFQVTYCKPRIEEAVSYYSKVRPNGDVNVAQFLERRTAQYYIEIYRVTEPQKPRVAITAPELLLVTELPEFILFAAKEACDPKRDTFQLFRRKVNSDMNETVPYQLRPDVALKMLFVSELKKVAQGQHLRLYYDILSGYTPEQLKGLVVRTVDIYDGPLHQVKRIRCPMKPTENLNALCQYIQKDVFPCSNGRILLNEGGLVRYIAPTDYCDDSALLRFDVVPPDQVHLKQGEFLAVASICRYSKNQDNAVPTGQSFLFKVIPGEFVDETRKRIAKVNFADAKLMEWIVFQTSSRILNGDESLDQFISANEVVKVVLPDRAKTNTILRGKKT